MSPTSKSVEGLVLPLPLLLLVHLYILQYPHANNAEYDHDLFNPRVRGLRDRIRTMEDIAHFLVARMEGKRIQSIFAGYPCRQPSESLSFRTSLTKYLEQTRHQAVYPSRAAGDAPTATGKLAASWWKDVVVRKSLLEECAGDKFERLMVSLSTHALMKAMRPIPFESLSACLRSQPLLYSAAVAKYNSARQGWTRSASLLLRWENDLKVGLQNHPKFCSGKYDGLPTSRLKALARSKLEILSDLHWASNEARSALSAFIELFGLRSLTVDRNKLVSPPPQTLTDHELAAVPPSSLPVAAARHPSYLKKLKRPILQSLKSNGHTTSAGSSKTHAEIILSVQIDASRRVQQLLADAAAYFRKRQSGLRHAVSSMASRIETDGVSVPSFWEFPTNVFEISYNPEPDKDLCLLTGLERDFAILHPDTEGSSNPSLEKRIDEIRSSVLVPYPVPPDLAAPRLPAQEATILASRIPHLKPKVGPVKQTVPRPPRHLFDSPKQTPASVRRKSVRFSTARRRTGRPSMFGAFAHFDDDDEDGIDLLIDQTHDFPTDDDDSDEREGEGASTTSKTPKAKRKTPKVNRIWTAGTPSSRNKSTPRPAMRPSDLNFLTRLFDVEEPVLELPPAPGLLQSSTSSLFSEGHSPSLGDSDKRCDVGDVDATPVSKKHLRTLSNDENEDDFFVDDAPSMTLKEILLSADSGDFDLLVENEEEEDLALALPDFREEDGSFVWE